MSGSSLRMWWVHVADKGRGQLPIHAWLQELQEPQTTHHTQDESKSLLNLTEWILPKQDYKFISLNNYNWSNKSF